jgi:hypothetical protein
LKQPVCDPARHSTGGNEDSECPGQRCERVFTFSIDNGIDPRRQFQQRRTGLPQHAAASQHDANRIVSLLDNLCQIERRTELQRADRQAYETVTGEIDLIDHVERGTLDFTHEVDARQLGRPRMAVLAGVASSTGKYV